MEGIAWLIIWGNCELERNRKGRKTEAIYLSAEGNLWGRGEKIDLRFVGTAE